MLLLHAAAACCCCMLLLTEVAVWDLRTPAGSSTNKQHHISTSSCTLAESLQQQKFLDPGQEGQLKACLL
jgi:hypothetical protein